MNSPDVPPTGQTSSLADQEHNEETERYSGNETAVFLEGLASKLTPTSDVILGFCLSAFAILILVMNGLVLITVARRRRVAPPIEVYIVSLAAIDILPAFSLPLDVVSLASHRWKFGIAACKLSSTFVYFCGIANISTVTLMSLMRYIKVCHIAIGNRIRRCTVYWTLGCVYINAAVWALSPHIGWAYYAPEPFGVTCGLDWVNMSVSYLVAVLVVNYILPIVTLGYSYGSMAYTLCKASGAMANRKKRRDIYMIRMTLAMTLGFVLAWTPYAILSFYHFVDKSTDTPLFINVAAPILAKSSNFYNPVIYFVSIKKFRQDVKEVFGPMLREVIQSDSDTKRGVTGYSDIPGSPSTHVPLQAILGADGQNLDTVQVGSHATSSRYLQLPVSTARAMRSAAANPHSVYGISCHPMVGGDGISNSDSDYPEKALLNPRPTSTL